MLTSFQQFSVNEAGAATKTAPAAPYIKKSIEDISKHHVDKEALISSLTKKVDIMCQAFADGLSKLVNNSVVPPPANKLTKPTNLPWFSHGIKGFVNKLTWGNHPGNPDWQHYESLQGYSTLKSMVSEAVDKLLEGTLNEDAVAISDVIQNYVSEFKKHLTAVIHQSLASMMEIGNSFGFKSAQFLAAHQKDLEDTAKSSVVTPEEPKEEPKPVPPVEPPPLPPAAPTPPPTPPAEPVAEPEPESPLPPKSEAKAIPTNEEMSRRRKKFLSAVGLSADSDVLKGLPPLAKKRELEKAKRHVAEIEDVFDEKTLTFKDPEKAIDIMSQYELDPNKAKDVRTLWPKAEHKALAPIPPKPLGIKREGTLPTLAEWTQVKADQIVEQIMKDATPDTKARYLKYRLQYGA